MIDNATESLKQQVLIGHLTNATGLTIDDARRLLLANRWDFEAAMSEFFDEAANHRPNAARMCQPCNTPATPPSFGDLLHKMMSAGDWSASNGGTPTNPMMCTTTFANTMTNTTKVLTSCNNIGSTAAATSAAVPCERYWAVDKDLVLVQNDDSNHSGMENAGLSLVQQHQYQ